MQKKTQGKTKNKVGRPPKYPNIDLKQVEALAGLGLKDTEIANVLGISERTINYWKSKPEFLQALKTGKDKADTQVIRALYRQATEMGNVTAMIFWLKNRRKEDWRDRIDLDHSGSIEQRVLNMTEEERKARLEELKKKLLNAK